MESTMDLCSNTNEPSDRYRFGSSIVVSERKISEVQTKMRTAALDLTQHRVLNFDLSLAL